jgi:hypothetical protein
MRLRQPTAERASARLLDRRVDGQTADASNAMTAARKPIVDCCCHAAGVRVADKAEANAAQNLGAQLWLGRQIRSFRDRTPLPLCHPKRKFPSLDTPRRKWVPVALRAIFLVSGFGMSWRRKNKTNWPLAKIIAQGVRHP